MINQNLASKNYNISQADMYQLYAYGKKYQLKNGHIQLALIYPQYENFNSKLQFKYEEYLEIDIIPFDFNRENESLKLLLMQGAGQNPSEIL